MIRSLVALALAALATPSFANGVITEFPAGGLVFKEAADIAIAREDLRIGLQRIDVHYDYRSDATETQHVTIGFPMPLIPVDGGPDAPENITELEGHDLTDYMLFTAKVDGKPVKTTLHGFAWLDGVNVTSELEAVGLPLFMTYAQYEEAFAALAPEVLDDLQAKGIIFRDEERTYVSPAWSYQSVFEWQQDFVPGVTKVDISYRPLSGYPSDIGDYYEADPDQRYCVGEDVRKAIADFRDKGIYYEVQTVGYITTTATYWKGPIGEFNLTIVKEPPNAEYSTIATETAFCDSTKFTETDTGFTWSEKDFVPKKDIAVVWYSFIDYGDEE